MPRKPDKSRIVRHRERDTGSPSACHPVLPVISAKDCSAIGVVDALDFSRFILSSAVIAALCEIRASNYERYRANEQAPETQFHHSALNEPKAPCTRPPRRSSTRPAPEWGTVAA